MKRLVSILLMMVMAMSALPVFADGVAEEVLLAVKAKIDVPEELEEFNYSENKYDDVLRYDFNWHTEDYAKELYVSSDSRGRIVTYSYYEQVDYSSDRALIDYTLSDAQPMAEEAVKKMFPEYIGKEHDRLVLEYDNITSSYSGRYKTFVFPFKRCYEQKVESNRVVVRVRATKDKMYVQSVNASLDEDAVFIPLNLQAEKFAQDAYHYEQKFPIKLYYATDYSEDEPKVKLFYSMDKGYVQIDTGEVVTEEYFDRYAGITEDSADMEMGAGGTLMNKNEALLRPEEKAEIEKMESLVKPGEVEAVLRGLPLLKLTEDMKFTESYTYKSDKKYFVRFTLEGTERYMDVTYNGETGEVTSIYSHFKKYDATDKDEEETIIAPEEDMKAFAKALCGEKLDETEAEFVCTNTNATMNAKRIVNGVPFAENSISVTYDAKKDAVTRYYINWKEDVSDFPSPDDVIGLENARKIIFKDRPQSVWVKQKEGYVLTITIKNAVTLDAITGEVLYKNTDKKVKYTDIKAHWAKEEINVLWEHDIYLSGDKFKPDEAINQSDMIKLFSACRDSGIIPIGWEKDKIAAYAFENGYVEAAEPDKIMTRGEAFKAMVEILGYGDIAEYDIYKSSYSDMAANGSAEILKAMGVLTGDIAREKDNLTRAEAAVMVYRYLSK